MHAIDPTILFLTKFPAHSIFLKGDYHYSPFFDIRQPTDYSFANPRLWGMRLWAGQSSRPSIRSRYTSSPTSRRSPPSRRRRFVHINAGKDLPARDVDCAARAAYRCARALHSAARLPRGARHAKPQPVSTMVLRSYYRQLFAYARARALSLLATKVRRLHPAVTCTCSSTRVQQLPPRCSLLAAKVRCCPTGPTLSPRPAPHLPRPWGQATHPLACPYSTDALGQSHTVSPTLPLSLPPHCGPPPPARAGLALLRRPAPASPSSTGPRRRR